MSLRPVARLVAALVPALLLLPVAAHAETVTIEDGAGDARAYNFAGEFGTEPPARPAFLDAPAETSVDVVRTDITHARRVTVTLHFRDLVDLDQHSLDMRVFTPRARFTALAFAGEGPGRAILVPDRGIVQHTRPCRTVRSRYDLAADTVTVSFPAACIDDPRWLQVAIVATRLDVTPLGDGSVNLAGFADDAFRAHVSERSRAKSPRIHRG
ncbi:hypothetical protein KDN32_05440 [Nocardioides sp. J2M5]|uniref:hypothetical protein n=1 Tax=Nocardioides palaemonis TaxID=2829810 RepID=UPI001BAA24EF|nr:hypothetical protein [Nocardioides palaemonis]MBS2937180.1 hypothetical protein [Nocardioides palaemonis]